MASNNSRSETNPLCMVCLSRIIEPYSLTCGHTACLTCILKKEKGNHVICPVCYSSCNFSDILPDNKTLCYLEDEQNENQDISTIITVSKSPEEGSVNLNNILNSKTWCQLCNVKSSSFQCLNCNLKLCTECKESHLSNSLNANHKIVDDAHTAKKLRNALKEVVKAMAMEKEELTTKARQVRHNLQNFYVDEAKELVNLRKLQLLRIKELEDYHNNLEAQIREDNKRKTDILENFEKYLRDSTTLLQEQMQFLMKSLQTCDASVIEDTIVSVQSEAIPELQRIKVKSNFNPDVPAPAKVVEGKDWNPALSTVLWGQKYNTPGLDKVDRNKSSPIQSMRIQMNTLSSTSRDIATGATSRSHNSGPLGPNAGATSTSQVAQSYSGCKFVPTKDVTIKYTPQNVSLFGNKVFCTGHNPDGIYVYDRDLSRVKVIKHPHIEKPKSVVRLPSGDLIIACDDNFGLHQFSSYGFEKVVRGSFADVCCYTKEDSTKVYALEYKLSHIVVFKCEGRTLVPKNKISLHYAHVTPWDTLRVHHKFVYVSSFENSHIYQYTRQGDMVMIGEDGSTLPGLFTRPRLCDIDRHGSPVVLDSGNKRLQVYTRDSAWTVLSLRGIFRQPTAVAMDRNLEFIVVSDVATKKLIAAKSISRETAI